MNDCGILEGFEMTCNCCGSNSVFVETITTDEYDGYAIVCDCCGQRIECTSRDL